MRMDTYYIEYSLIFLLSLITLLSHEYLACQNGGASNKTPNQNCLQLTSRLHSRLLAARAEIVPEVKEEASDVVSSEAIEGNLRVTSFESNTKHDRDDESTVTRNGRRPSKDGSRFFRREENTNRTERSTIHHSTAEEEIDEEEDEQSIVCWVRGGVVHLADCLQKSSLTKCSNSAPNNGDVGNLCSSILVCQNTSHWPD